MFPVGHGPARGGPRDGVALIGHPPYEISGIVACLVFRLGSEARASAASLGEGAQAHLAENATGVILPSTLLMRRWL